jgi:hypothetical protein
MAKWRQEPGEYYLKYLSDFPLPKQPQTQAMGVGSAFDAYVKSFLYEHLFGRADKAGNDGRFALDAIFCEQVEPQNRDLGRLAGPHLLQKYRDLGAMDGLLSQLKKSVGKPRFEMDVRGVLSAGRTGNVNGVPFRVKPDLFFVNEEDAHVLLDWKVNGYCSQSGVSPMKGYVKLRAEKGRPSGHEEAKPEYYKGILVNGAKGIEHYNEEWGCQLVVGSWMCGEEVGGKFVGVVHQLVCRPTSIRVAEHASIPSVEFQNRLHAEAVAMWEAIHSDHVFRHLTKEESIERCKLLDQRRDGLTLSEEAFSPILEDE